MDLEPERRPCRPRPLERSLSYSEAIGDESRRSSIQIPSLRESDVYTNEELKKHYRISQTYVEGREITFESMQDEVFYENPIDVTTDSSDYDSEQELNQGLVLSIDVENTDVNKPKDIKANPKTDPKCSKNGATSPETDKSSPKTNNTRHYSSLSTRKVNSSSLPSDIIPDSTLGDGYDRIEVMESVFGDYDNTGSTIPSGSTHGFAMHSIYRGTKRRKGKSHRRRHGRPIRSRRAVLKDGEENVPIRSHIPAKSIKYMRDVVNTVINSKWRFIMLLMFFAHWAFWLTFAGIWFAVSQSYADDIGDGRQHCVNGTSSFAGMLMMSVETQMTIGYGVRFPNEECPEAIIVMVIEIVAGTALSGGLSSLLFTKLVRPNRHVSSVGFSKKAAVCLRDGELVLQFRVWDLMNVHLVGTNVSAYIMKPIRTLEGELVPNYIHQLKLKQANALLLWPITVCHVIDAESPLYDFSAQDMMEYRFEIVVSLTGSSKNMGTVTQSRTSYLSKEILWGYRFRNVLHYSKSKEAYVIDVDNLNTVDQVQTPLCSASRLKEFEEDIKSTPTFTSPSSMADLSLSQEDSTYRGFPSEPLFTGDSLPSTPSTTFARNVTGSQRSYGWNFRRFYPEKIVENVNH